VFLARIFANASGFAKFLAELKVFLARILANASGVDFRVDFQCWFPR